MVTKGLRGVVTTAALALAVAALWPATRLRAQLPMPASTIFEMTGFIQSATLDPEQFPGDPFRGGTITLNNHKVIVPRNTIFQMPATSLTWKELFALAPAPWGITKDPAGKEVAVSGLALNDAPPPAYTFEVTVQGNRVNDDYIAGLLFISNLSLQQHQGFISAIDYANGEMTVGGSRVRLNDPIGRFGRAMTHDKRFTIDEENPTVKSETGYPMCLPRTRVDQNVDDPLCPQGNRPVGKSIFTMGTPPAPTAAERQTPSLRSQNTTAATLDPWRAAPFEIGDYVMVMGPIVKDAAGQYISAHTVSANVGIFTAPGTQPTYVAIDVILMGTGPLADATLAQEGAKRTRVEGFTTDFTAPVTVSAVDVDACTGQGLDRLWTVQAIDPGPPTGAVAGRWRFRPGAPLFDLKGFPFLPATREVHVMSFNGTVITMNGLSAGEYQAPNFEFILPENRGIGSPVVPGNFETMAFLAQGSGPRGGAYTGQLDPWPGDAATRPVRNACAVVGADVTVKSGTLVSLDGSASIAANVPTGPVTYTWSQLSGTAVTLTNANTASASFTAPTIAVGGANQTLTFKLTTTPSNGGAAVDSRTVTVTVTAPPDTVPPTVAAPTLIQSGVTNPLTVKRGTALTLSSTATDNVAVTGVTFFYSYALNGVKQTGTVIAPKPASGTTWSGTFTPSSSVPSATTYTFTAVASDAAGNQTTSAATAKAIQ
jgi:K319-like protein